MEGGQVLRIAAKPLQHTKEDQIQLFLNVPEFTEFVGAPRKPERKIEAMKHSRNPALIRVHWRIESDNVLRVYC